MSHSFEHVCCMKNLKFEKKQISFSKDKLKANQTEMHVKLHTPTNGEQRTQFVYIRLIENA